MHLKTSSAKWRPFCLGLNVLNSMHQAFEGVPSISDDLLVYRSSQEEFDLKLPANTNGICMIIFQKQLVNIFTYKSIQQMTYRIARLNVRMYSVLFHTTVGRLVSSDWSYFCDKCEHSILNMSIAVCSSNGVKPSCEFSSCSMAYWHQLHHLDKPAY